MFHPATYVRCRRFGASRFWGQCSVADPDNGTRGPHANWEQHHYWASAVHSHEGPFVHIGQASTAASRDRAAWSASFVRSRG